MIGQEHNRRARAVVPLSATLVLALILAGCGYSTGTSQTGGAGAGSQATTAPPATTAPANSGQGKTVNVSIKNFSFGQPLTVPVGTTVVWTNQDDAPHTVTATNGAFASGQLTKGATFRFTFAKEGTFDYSCTIHPNMKGRVVVTK